MKYFVVYKKDLEGWEASVVRLWIIHHLTIFYASFLPWVRPSSSNPVLVPRVTFTLTWTRNHFSCFTLSTITCSLHVFIYGELYISPYFIKCSHFTLTRELDLDLKTRFEWNQYDPFEILSVEPGWNISDIKYDDFKPSVVLILICFFPRGNWFLMWSDLA